MIQLVCDSLAYITREDAQRLNVSMVPMNYSIAHTQLVESFPTENGDYLNLLERFGITATTSQPPIGAFMSTYSEQLARGRQVLVLTISSRLSGTYSAAAIAAQNIGGSDIAVVDTRTAGGGVYMLLERARALCDQGLSLKEVAAALESERERVCTVFSVNSLDALRRSGRINLLRLSIGTILNVRPILVLREGALICERTVRGKEEMMRNFLEQIPKDAKEVLVMHIGQESAAMDLMARIRRAVPAALVRHHHTGPVLGVHLGVRAIGIAYIK